jgi:hypothetical protein
MLLRNMVAARRYPSLAVALRTTSSPVKSRGICFLAARATAVKITPMTADVAVATTTENLAAFGWLAPSSFDTRTLTYGERNGKEEQRISVASIMATIESSKIFFLQKYIYIKGADKPSSAGRYLTAALKPTATISVQS